jgi:hypothetical protein
MRDKFAKKIIFILKLREESKLKDSEFAAVSCVNALSFITSQWITDFLI